MFKKKFFLNLIFMFGWQMLMEHFKKYEKIAEKQKEEIKKEREEQERKRKEKIAKRKAEEQAEMERLKKEEEEPKIKEITDEEAEKIQKELEKVLSQWGLTDTNYQRTFISTSKENIIKLPFWCVINILYSG